MKNLRSRPGRGLKTHIPRSNGSPFTTDSSVFARLTRFLLDFANLISVIKDGDLAKFEAFAHYPEKEDVPAVMISGTRSPAGARAGRAPSE